MERREKMIAGTGLIERIFERAEKDNRSFLLEHEVYALLRASGIDAPRFFFVKKGGRGTREELVLEKVAFPDLGFGSELLLGIRNSREFGPVVTMGLGGLDVEYVNERLKEKRAVAIGSAHLLRRYQPQR